MMKVLKSLLELINTSILVLEAVARVREEITDLDTHLTSATSIHVSNQIDINTYTKT